MKTSLCIATLLVAACSTTAVSNPRAVSTKGVPARQPTASDSRSASPDPRTALKASTRGIQADDPFASISREPMWFIQCFAGTSVRGPENPAGLTPPWNREPNAAVSWLRKEFKDGYDAGARRFFVNRPMGTDGIGHVSAASWLTIPQEKRDLMAALFREITSGEAFGEPCEIIVFIGSGMVAPDSLTGWNPSHANEGELLGKPGSSASRVTIGGWLSAGVSAFAIDNSAPADERDHFMWLHREMATNFGVPVYGEAFPSFWRNNKFEMDVAATQAMPWIATIGYMNTRPWIGSVNPRTTRMFVWFEDRASAYTERDADEFLHRGFSIITRHPGMFARAKEFERRRR